MVYSDSHAHLGQVAEEVGLPGLEALLGAYEAPGQGPGQPGKGPLLLDIGTELGDFPARLALAGQRSFLRYSLGLWPAAGVLADPEASLEGLRSDIAAAQALEAQGLGPKSLVVALGEGGLDYHHHEGSPASQARLFEGQLDLAARLGLPFIVHTRKAFDDTLALLRGQAQGQRVIIHCFGYGPREAEAFLAEGCLISFAGNLTYKGAEALREALLVVPRGRLLLETDSPYMNPMPLRGRPGSPLDIERTYALAAGLLGMDPVALAEEVRATMEEVFLK